MPIAAGADAHHDQGQRPDHGMYIPRSILIAAAAMIVTSIAFAFLAKTTDIGAVRFAPDETVASRELRFVTADDGNITVQDALDGSTIDTLPAKSDGFVKIVLRSVGHERKLSGIGMDQPFRLSRLKNDQIILEDLGTKRILMLTAFGNANEAVFSRYLGLGSDPQ